MGGQPSSVKLKNRMDLLNTKLNDYEKSKENALQSIAIKEGDLSPSLAKQQGKYRKEWKASRDNKEENMIPSPVVIRQERLKTLEDQRPKLKDRQMELVCQTWTIVKDNISTVGAHIFVRYVFIFIT